MPQVQYRGFPPPAPANQFRDGNRTRVPQGDVTHSHFGSKAASLLPTLLMFLNLFHKLFIILNNAPPWQGFLPSHLLLCMAFARVRGWPVLQLIQHGHPPREDEGKIRKYYLEWGELRILNQKTIVFFFNIITGIKHNLLLQLFLEFKNFFNWRNTALQYFTGFYHITM